MLVEVMTVTALAVSVVQLLLMGMIGYPLARRRPGGMEAFQRSGFTWWLFTLVLVFGAAVLLTPERLAPRAPSDHDPGTVPSLLILVSGAVAMIVIELILDWLTFRGKPSAMALAERERYDNALPGWAAKPFRECMLVAVIALLEEAVFRAVGLGGLIHGFGLDKFTATGICVVAFGACHWYYGWRQITLKMVDGLILSWMALSAGWPVAAAAHVLLNVVLTVITECRNQMSRSGVGED